MDGAQVKILAMGGVLVVLFCFVAWVALRITEAVASALEESENEKL